MSLNVLMMAAGTGGHVFPALAVADELAQRGATIHWLGTPNGMENELVAKHGYQMHHVHMQGMRRNGLARMVKLPVMLLKAVMAARSIIQEQHIDVVVGFGGYVTAPGGFAARLCGKPLIIHEQNAIAGMSNKMLARFADRVLQAFDGAFGDEFGTLATVGNPVRAAITQIADPHARYDVSDASSLKVLVVGGSLGAAAINDAVVGMFAHLQRPISLRHQCGKDNHEKMLVAYSQANIDTAKHIFQVSPFIDDMAAAYAWADVVVCRAGALTVTELATAGVAAIFIPLPHAVDDHQTANAKTLTEIGGGILLPQSELSAKRLADVLDALTRQDCQQMAANAKSQAKYDVAQNVADIVQQMAK